MRYAELDMDTASTVVDTKIFEREIPLDNIKKVNGRPVLLKIEVTGRPDTYDPELYTLQGPEFIVHADWVEEKYTLVPKEGNITDSLINLVKSASSSYLENLERKMNTLEAREAVRYAQTNDADFPVLEALAEIEEATVSGVQTRVMLAYKKNYLRVKHVIKYTHEVINSIINAVDNAHRVDIYSNLNFDYEPSDSEVENLNII